MSQAKGQGEADERYSTLLNNAGAIRAICSAVEGTLGPKGLDTMLVGPRGEVIITNDGVTILEKMEVSHPAARLLVEVARSQQEAIGDGTTTATVIAGALVAEGAALVTRGVPAAKVVAGMGEAIRAAQESLRSRTRTIADLGDPVLRQIARVAGRERDDIAALVLEGAAQLGRERLSDDGFVFADCVAAKEKAASEVWPGLLLGHKLPGHAWVREPTGRRVLVLADALEPESHGEEALATEAGFRLHLEQREQFRSDLAKLQELGVGLVALDRGADPEAEQFCADHGILLLTRVLRKELQRLCEATGALPLKKTALRKPPAALAKALGTAESLSYDDKLERVRLAGAAGHGRFVSVVIGASTREVGAELARIARDAASAVQAAVRGGYVPGGGALELALAADVERFRAQQTGMEAFGAEAVVHALRKPMAQIVTNAGFNPLEKVEEARSAQLAEQSDEIAVDCDTGALMNCVERGVIDPAEVKRHALQAATEIASAVLRIHTVVKMKGHSVNVNETE
ncbi:TCP-1/cpn60 chaperonin family protein [Paenibacillus turpanensis]|uniref:TCP-1/cpn60 chaperonin family protein n=1 Tax=Paenibacillus turpanensis TaxID=2689078 RepID=UPI00140D6597|nr:TCP-1/cpn60 chaperonin family protein [Paenibacillus turpanensis]